MYYTLATIISLTLAQEKTIQTEKEINYNFFSLLEEEFYEKIIIDTKKNNFPNQQQNPFQSLLENKNPYVQEEKRVREEKRKKLSYFQKNSLEHNYLQNEQIISQTQGRTRAQEDIYTAKLHYHQGKKILNKKPAQVQETKIHGTRFKKNNTQQAGWRQYI
jgi:hypothetical protein